MERRRKKRAKREKKVKKTVQQNVTVTWYQLKNSPSDQESPTICY